MFNPLDLTGKKFLITGAASGLGKATAILLSRLNAGLVLVDISEDGLQQTRKECPSDALCLSIDLRDAGQIKSKISEHVPAFGKLDGFAHLAGRPYISPLKTISEKATTETYMVNTYAALELAKAFTHKSVSTGNSGSIVFVSSVYGLVGSAANAGYAMSKAALHGITKSLAIELAPKNIRVNCVAPGFIKTKMLGDVSGSFNDEYHDLLNKLHPLGMGNPDDVAYSIAFLLSDMAKWITGTVLSVDGGFTAQ